MEVKNQKYYYFDPVSELTTLLVINMTKSYLHNQYSIDKIRLKMKFFNTMVNPRNFYILFLTLLLFQLHGCGILVGNVKPLTEKSSSYHLLKLDDLAPSEWKKISSQQISYDKEEPDISSPDVTYQSLKNSSIISLNSSCKTNASKPQTLEKITDLLLLGISNIKDKKQNSMSINSLPALETSLIGVLNNQKVSIKTVITRYGNCVYDFMYIAQPHDSDVYTAIFSQFIASFNVN